VTPLRSIGRRINDLGSTAACNRFTAELRDERIEVRSLTLKLQDFKVRAKERVDRGEEELRSAEARHSRELEKLRRKMRQEKQDEIGQMMEKVCALILPPRHPTLAHSTEANGRVDAHTANGVCV
jgi:DNA anti-recombination protein RmuC